MWGECWEIKDKIGEKKFQGARNLGGGNVWGKCKKRGGKTFWPFQKVVGIFLGVTTILGGEFFRKNLKKKIPGGILWKVVKKKFRGDFLGGSYTGGRVWGNAGK